MPEESHHEALRERIIGCDREEPGRQPIISSIGIPTCDRPDALHRCAKSFLDNCRVYGRKPRVLVTDDSTLPAYQAANVAYLKNLHRVYPEFQFTYAGFAEKRSYSKTLARFCGLDPAVLEFALFNPENLSRIACGPNRNALFLETVGECFLSVDDDVVCHPSVEPNMSRVVKVTSRYDPTRVWMFPDRQTLLRDRPSCVVDLLALQESILGKSLGALLHSRPEQSVVFGRLSRNFRYRLQSGPTRIKVSWNGIYGDSGARYPNYYLWKDRSIFQQLTAGEEIYRSLSLSRQIFRSPACLTVGASGYCQSTALAYDHRALLPPFMPLRGLDFVFGQTLVTCFRDSLIGYHPWALMHAPVEARRNSSEDIQRGSEAICYYEILKALIATYSDGNSGTTGSESLQKLGDHLCSIGALSAGEFEELLQSCLWGRIGRRINRFDRILQDAPQAPRYWADDLLAQIRVLRGKLTAAGLRQSVLAEESNLPPEQRVVLAQRLTARFGRLLQAWPALIEAVRDLKAKETHLGRPLP